MKQCTRSTMQTAQRCLTCCAGDTRVFNKSRPVVIKTNVCCIVDPPRQHRSPKQVQATPRSSGASSLSFVRLKLQFESNVLYDVVGVQASGSAFLNLFHYDDHINFGKNCVTHYLVSIGYAFIGMNKHTLFGSGKFILVCSSMRILLLNTITVLPRCSN